MIGVGAGAEMEVAMNVRDLVPWPRSSRSVSEAGTQNPFLALRRDMDRLFDEFWREWDLPALARGVGGAFPSVEVDEDDKEIRVSAELPGMEEKDVEVVLKDNVLTLRGEKKTEKTEKGEGNGGTYSERYYGRFERSFTLDSEVDADKVKATFKNGVLTVTLPKTETAREKERRIPIGK